VKTWESRTFTVANADVDEMISETRRLGEGLGSGPCSVPEGAGSSWSDAAARRVFTTASNRSAPRACRGASAKRKTDKPQIKKKKKKKKNKQKKKKKKEKKNQKKKKNKKKKKKEKLPPQKPPPKQPPQTEKLVVGDAIEEAAALVPRVRRLP